MTKAATKAEREHMGRVAALGCICCHLMGNGHQPAQVHHIREGQGGAQRASHWLTVPLCPDCHTGTHGVHGDRAYLRILKLGELDLLAETIARLSRSAA